jgi:hypothetical protein
MQHENNRQNNKSKCEMPARRGTAMAMRGIKKKRTAIRLRAQRWRRGSEYGRAEESDSRDHGPSAREFPSVATAIAVRRRCLAPLRLQLGGGGNSSEGAVVHTARSITREMMPQSRGWH